MIIHKGDAGSGPFVYRSLARYKKLGNYKEGNATMISPELLRQWKEGTILLRPCPGRCIVQIDKTPAFSPGGLHIPESARGVKVRDKAYSGTVLAMTPRRTKQGFPGKELFEAGDRVWVMLLLEDLGKEVIVTMNTRVCAVLENGLP